MSFLKIKLRYLTMPLLLCSGILVFGQTNEEVLKPIHLLFEGMKEADSAKVKKAFLYEATMFTSYKNNKGVEIFEEMEVDEFVAVIAKKPKDQPQWIEKLYNTSIKVDGNIAQVWTEYSFFVGEQFIHCGVDAIQLVKTNGAWKILQIVDTRRKEGCKED